MSALSKVFVVFVFILSVAFFGTSATLFKMRQDWKEAYLSSKKEMNDQLEKLKIKNTELGSTNDLQHNTLIETKSREDQIAKELKQVREDLNEEKKKAQTANSDQAKANGLSTQLAATVAAEKARNKEIEDALTKVKSDLDTALVTMLEANKQKDSMRLDLAKVQTDLHLARTEYTELSDKYETINLIFEGIKEHGGSIPTGKPAPAIDALVNAVDSKEKLVVISAGKDQKVESGFEFTVYRGDEFIGKVQVIKVYPDLAGARILFTKEGAEIQRGDKASTKLN